MENLITEVQNIHNVSLILLKGNLTADADDQLFSLINNVMTEGIAHIIFDLSKVSYINSAGFGILIALIDDIKRQNGVIIFAGLSPHFKKTAKLIGLHRFASFYRTVDEAFSAFNSPETEQNKTN